MLFFFFLFFPSSFQTPCEFYSVLYTYVNLLRSLCRQQQVSNITIRLVSSFSWTGILSFFFSASFVFFSFFLPHTVIISTLQNKREYVVSFVQGQYEIVGCYPRSIYSSNYSDISNLSVMSKKSSITLLNLLLRTSCSSWHFLGYCCQK